jgi:hypothetical protein
MYLWTSRNAHHSILVDSLKLSEKAKVSLEVTKGTLEKAGQTIAESETWKKSKEALVQTR